MAEIKVVQEILSASIIVDFVHGRPHDEALNMALQNLLIGMAMKIRITGTERFPLNFPMRMTLESETVNWSLMINMKLESGAGLDEA